MRRLVAVAAISVAGMLAGPLVVLPARASRPPQPITIHIQKRTGPNGTGTFTASGAFIDTGAVTNSDFDREAASYPTTEVLQVTQVLHGASGDITVNEEIKVSQSGTPGVEYEDGNWQVASGTAGYAGLQGGGNETAVVNNNTQQLSRTLQGEVH